MSETDSTIIDNHKSIPHTGMLYIATVQMTHLATKERIKKQLLIVGTKREDISLKLAWFFDQKKYGGIHIKSLMKLRDKVHVLRTTVKKPKQKPALPVDKKQCKVVDQVPGKAPEQEYHRYSVGMSLNITGVNENHILRKLGTCFTSMGSLDHRETASLPEGATLTIEEVPMKSGYAAPRDVTHEINKPTFVRG
jgi:hypothetical protein